MKIKKFLEKNIEKILITILYISPFIDLITSFMIRYLGPSFSLGIVIRSLILIGLGYFFFFINKTKDKRSLIYLSLISIYMSIYILNIFIFKDISVFDIELKFLIKSFYFPLLLIFLLDIFKTRNIVLKYRHFILPALVYTFSIMIANITNTGFSSYGGYKIGTAGWFFAANEIGTIVGVIFPILLLWAIKTRYLFDAYIVLIIYIVAALIIGTKVPLLSIIIALVAAIAVTIINFIFTRQKKYLRILLLPILITSAFLLVIFPYSPAGKNLNMHFKLFKIHGLEDFLDEDNTTGSTNIVLSSRDAYLKQTQKAYAESSNWEKLMGIGIVENFGTKKEEVQVTEMDFHDFFYKFGPLGFIIYFLAPLTIIFSVVKKYLSKTKKYVFDLTLNTLIISAIIGFGIALVAGHVLTAPAVSTYLAFILILIYAKLNPTQDNHAPKIWVDITNSPHAILFNPIIKKMQAEGYEVTVTARDYAQTLGLLKLFNIKYTLIGDHKGKSSIKKIYGLFERTWQLSKFVRNKNFDASLSMSSQTAMITSKIFGIPHMTLSDYEYTAGHHINFRLAQHILLPEGVEPKVLRIHGARKENVIFYKGLKEQFYIHYYLDEYNKKYPGKDPVREKFKIKDNQILVVMRPEATMAHYQTNNNELSFEIVEYLSKHELEPIIIVLPRVAGQKEEYKKRHFKNVIIPNEVINGIDLVVSADLIIGAGGTVNREAAAVGTPAYTIYQGGKFGAVDRMLLNTKRMIQIKDQSDFKKIKLIRKKNKAKAVGEDFSNWYLVLIKNLITKYNNKI